MVTETKKPEAPTAKTYEQFIRGEWVKGATAETYERKNPATGALVETIPWGDVEDARKGIDAARAAFDADSWAKAPATTRAQVLRKTAEKIRAEMMTLGALLSKEVGKPTAMAIAEIAMAADVYDYYAGLALDMRGDAITNYAPDAVGLAVHEPVGVVGVITPWNFPVLCLVEARARARRGMHRRRQAVGVTAGTTFELARMSPRRAARRRNQRRHGRRRCRRRGAGGIAEGR